MVSDGNNTLTRHFSGSSWTDAVGLSTYPLSETVGNVGVSLTLTAVQEQFIGLSNGVPSQAILSEFGLRLNPFGQVVVTEGDVIRGLFGNYQRGTTIKIVWSMDNTVQYFVDSQLAYTSSVSPVGMNLSVVLSIFQDGASISIPRWLGKDEWCFGVACRPAGICNEEGMCREGTCFDVLSANGTACNDGNVSTTEDVCISGVCQGTDLCVGIDCGVESDCRFPNRCVFGSCFAGLRRPDGTECDDLNTRTEHDTCISGICVGTPVTTTTTTVITSTTTETQFTLAPTGDPCTTVTCPTADGCHEPFTCSSGRCFVGEALTDGTICNDRNPLTSFDRCVGGVCAGIDLCIGVSCVPQDSQCENPGSCVAGSCVPSLRPNGTLCNDNNTATLNDACVSGTCMGTDICESVTCTPLSQCHVAGECIRGVCSNPFATVGTPCDDGNTSTVGDACTISGVCVGVPPCFNVTCPSTTCHTAGTCVATDGSCAQGMPLPLGTACDDDNASTIRDMCTAAGECIGFDPCAGVVCTEHPCRTPPSCFLGSCIQGVLVRELPLLNYCYCRSGCLRRCLQPRFLHGVDTCRLLTTK